MTYEIQRKRFSVNDYAQMITSGILREDDQVELIDGEVRQMRPIGPYHAALVARLTQIIIRQNLSDILLRIQDPIQLSDYSQPQPDLALVMARSDFYAHAHPIADDIYLLIEVSYNSLSYDRLEKLPRYAQAAIPEVWIIDTAGQQIEQYSQPAGNQYRTKHTWQRGEQIQAIKVDLTLDVTEILA